MRIRYLPGIAALLFMPMLAAQTVSPVTGLVEAPGHDLVAAHCSACHSTRLIAQNNMSRARWIETIRWMQDSQKLWPLGDAEPAILDYLETWYGPRQQHRRAPLPEHLMPGQTLIQTTPQSR